MPYIVEDPDGVIFETDIFLTPTTFNFGTTSDVASALTCSVYITRGNFAVSNNLYTDSNFYISSSVIFPTQLLTTQTGGVSIVTDSMDHIIIASFSSANSNTIWLGTASRIEGKELIIRRVDGSTATVSIQSSQTDIDDAQSITGNVSSLSLSNTGYYRLVRVNSLWRVMSWA